MPKNRNRSKQADPADLPVLTPGPQFSVVAAQEIPKPKDWQAFQRGCVVLFQAELKDPHAQEYGRNGQKQRGIDVLGRRNGDPDRFVGIQCRRYVEPLKKAEILKDCKAALAIKAGLKEIIFATTCPSDTKATDAAIEVEREFRAQGHDLKVVIYSWSDLELKISQHPTALAFFFPSAVASTAAQSVRLDPDSVSAIVEALARLQPSGQSVLPADVKAPADNSEDPALHAKIDLWRDLFRTKNSFVLAKEGLLELQSKEDLSGKPWAKFRIETNLGSVAISLGRHDEAAAYFEKAYAVRPTDCNAIANLALARTIQGRYEEAMELAKAALNSTPRSEQAVSYLLQAAARSSWQEDPATLIPADLVGSVHADMGLAEFLRKRNVPGWAEKTRELARNHIDLPEFRRADAIAVLELALGPDAFVGKPGTVSREDLERAANEMLAMAESCLTNGFADQHDLLAFVNNAAVLLRLTGRQADCESLLVRALPSLSDQPQLRRLLALSQAAQNRFDDAEVTLRGDQDPESRLLAAEMVARRDNKEAIKVVENIDAIGQDHLLELKWRIFGDLALRVRDYERVDTAIAGLANLPDGKLLADLLQIRRDAQLDTDEGERHARLIDLAGAEFTLANSLSRYLVADEMRNQGLPAEAAKLIEPIIDLQILNPATRLYLGCLVEARRDEAFRLSLANACPDVRQDPEILWLLATHSWNVGDLPESRRAVDALLCDHPDSAAARLLKIEILLRSDDIDDLLPELERPIERLAFTRLSDKFRVASLLGHFGHMDRAVAYAYRLFLENREISQAWLCFHGLVLQEGMNLETSERSWDPKVVCENSAVDIDYEDGEKQFIVIEPDGLLRRLDGDSWEPDHPLVRQITGLTVGAQFTNPANGKSGTIRQIRHKYVAKHHFVLANHEARFPDASAFRSIPVDVSTPDGLAPLLEELKAKHDWVEQEQESYRKGPWPLAILAHRVGSDTIETADGLAAQELSLKVALGSEVERNAAVAAIASNRAAGCVLDLLSFWTCWRLSALGPLSEVCGTVYIAQSTMDQLQSRRERISHSAQTGSKSARYQDGKIAVTDVAPEVVQAWLADVDGAIEWARSNAIVCPLIVPERLPDVLRDHLRDSPAAIFDSLVLAMQRDLLLVSDDLPTRDFGRVFGFGRSTWLHAVFMVAGNRRNIDFDTYVKWTAHLIGAGHNYLGVSSAALIRSAAIDAEAGEFPGYFFTQIGRAIGGAAAEPASHVRVVVEFMRHVWARPSNLPYRERATGLLLNQLIRERTLDYKLILRTVIRAVSDIRPLIEYLANWLRGHFLDMAA
jgi:tetratricopeptide (TPR) repeat protein